MNDAIASLAASLGDFPLDPDAGKAWLWAGAGDELLWASAEARRELGLDGAPGADIVEKSQFRSYAALLDLPEPEREPVRVQQIAVRHGDRGGVYTCLCRHVPLRGGGFGLLAVAIGAPARSMAAVKAEDAAPEAGRLTARTAPSLSEPPRPPPLVSANVAEVLRDRRVAPAPSWTKAPDERHAPLRFVWQTDALGRFVHLSRELADAVGMDAATLIGRTWADACSEFDLGEVDDAARGFASRETWTAAPVLWPVAGADVRVPVELAGMRVMERGDFAGFRGYGIARIDKAVRGPGTAADAIAGDSAAREPGDEPVAARFGPAALSLIEAPDVSKRPGASGPIAEASSAASPAPEPAEAADDQPSKEARKAEPPHDPVDGLANAETPTAAGSGQEIADADATAKLSQTEREAFREIARALGRLQKQSGVLPTSAPPSPPLEDEQARDVAARSVRPLEILPQSPRQPTHQLPQRPIGGEDGPAEPLADARASAPIIPFEALQTRRAAAPKPEPGADGLTAIVNHVPIAVLVVQNGKPVFVNRPLLDMAGYPDFAAFVREDGARTLFAAPADDRSPDSRQFSIRTRAGQSIPVEADIVQVVWDNAPATLTSIRVGDAAAAGSRQKALELELLTARAELREMQSVLDTATDGVILLDGEGRILRLNRSAEALFGFDQNEIAGESLTILLEPGSHIAALDYLEGLRSNGVNSILNDGRDVNGRERNGGTIPLFMTMGRVGDRQSEPRFCAVVRDNTHWKKVEGDLVEAKRAAEDSNAQKTDFLAKVSHEIRTPLNAIIGFSQVMMAESFGPIGNERYRQYASDIHASGEHIISLVNDLLDLSKVAAGKLDLNFGRVDVNQLVAASVSMIQPQANAGRVIVRSQLSAALPPVVADERSVRQILLNLLSNAARFTEAGGQVVASTSLTDAGEVVIRVRDTGIGMGPDEVKRAMEPFRQIPGPRSSGGTGLGLPLTKALVEANRATLTIDSEPRKGTLVEVVFPPTRVLAE